VLNLMSPQGFGPIFYPFGPDECPSNYGACTDGTRWVGWPDAPPLVTFAYGGAVSAWAFVTHQHLQGLTTLGAASYNLYQVTTQVGSDGAIPVASLNTESFWSTTQIAYGEATGVVRNNYVSTVRRWRARTCALILGAGVPLWSDKRRQPCRRAGLPHRLSRDACGQDAVRVLRVRR
jgi:hypothetical protein